MAIRKYMSNTKFEHSEFMLAGTYIFTADATICSHISYNCSGTEHTALFRH